MISKVMLEIDNRRRLLGLTQGKLAELSGISAQTYTNLMKGRGLTTIRSLQNTLKELEDDNT